MLGRRRQARDERLYERLTDPDAVCMLSTRCCNPGTLPTDDALLSNLDRALRAAGVDAEVQIETLTDMLRLSRSISHRLGDTQRELLGQLNGLFASQGLAAFPIVVLGGRRIASFGGVAEVDQLVAQLEAWRAGRAD